MGQERPHVVQPPATGTPAETAASANGASSDGVPADNAPMNVVSHTDGAPRPSGGHLPNGGPRPNGWPRPNGAPPPIGTQAPAAQDPAGNTRSDHAAGPGPGDAPPNPDRNGQCTAPQLRRFIKSRPYVPMHELRRRFGIDGGDDDVTPVKLDPGWVYVGLPTREGSLLGDLLRAGEIGYELSLDPRTPIVIGVYPMRPIPRS
jgi:hypothetical protein